MTRGEDATPVPRSLTLATDLDVLAVDRVLTRRDEYLVVRSPSNPSFFWGNLLLFDDAPGEGDRLRWEAWFDAEFAGIERVRHRAFVWDRSDGAAGRAHEEFGDSGYTIDESIGLVAAPEELRSHPRENREVTVRMLDPGADAALWSAVLDLQTANREEGHDEKSYYEFAHARQRELRAHFVAGRGGWFVAVSGDGEIVGSCGVVVSNERGRFQSVDTALAHRRQGICSRLVVETARLAVERFAAEQLVVVADASYHALGLYESLGFRRQERVVGAFTWPESPKARAAAAS